MKAANIEGFFTNHSLQRTGGTRLFRAGVPHKLVKEATGHHSDSVDAYQITSDQQHQEMCRIIEKGPSATVSVNQSSVKQSEVADDKEERSNFEVKSDECNIKVGETNVCDIVTKLLGKLKKGYKTTVKIQLEITHE